MGNPGLRCFIAVPCPREIRRYLTGLQKRIRSVHKLPARFPKSSSLHITLQFLGDRQPQELEGIRSAMDAAAQGQPPFMLHPETVGIFPHNPRRVRVLWAGLGGEVVCMDRLYRSLSRELSQQEIKNDRQRFSPHITLARFKKAPPVRFMEKVGNDPWLAASGPEFRVEGIHLYQSELRPEGARYTCLHTSWFKGTN